MIELTRDERTDLDRLMLRWHMGYVSYRDVIAHVTELCDAYYAAGLVEGDLAHDGTIQAEAQAPPAVLGSAAWAAKESWHEPAPDEEQA